MSDRVFSMRAPLTSVSGFVSSAALCVSFVACGGGEQGDLFRDSGGSAGSSGNAGVSTAGSSSASQGGSASGSAGSSTNGGSSAGNSAGAATDQGGSGQGLAGAAGSSGGRQPSAAGDAGSPYQIECHGDTVECGDPESLLCLGIRVGQEVFGYACSNECEASADCSAAPASAESAAECVDFVTTSYCLLACRKGDTTTSCPDGMYCYVYQGSPVGYCLWR